MNRYAHRGLKRPSFLHGVIVAAILGFFASVVVATLTPIIGLPTVIRLAIPILALTYLLYLFSAVNERTGRVTTLILWSALTVVTWWISLPISLYLLIHVGAIWLVRTLYFHVSFTAALLDLGLSSLSVSTAVWALSRTGSLFLATWCFFLVQALFVVIPPTPAGNRKVQDSVALDQQKFEQARRQADQALRQMFTQ